MPNAADTLVLNERRYIGRSEERAYTSNITEVVVGPRTTDLHFNYEMPSQGALGKVRIWEGLTVNFSEEPVYEAPLDNNEGFVQVLTNALNFTQGAYIITISADEDVHSIAATETLLNGQPRMRGDSFIAVTAKTSNSISTVYSNPPNLTAYKEADWAIIYAGSELGKGEPLAKMPAPLDETSGIITINFPRGTLKSGNTYNVCLSVGSRLSTISAAYVFKYLI
ncbi:hypothetical protein [Vibrio sp. RE88]|uniref:hypothetical protein n=1 Tax=Vibrio sp. RE88 TaxID=2607610 RepID=UPI001493D5AB|nr:hypothetical protein [Vibrio sp. RE88]NOH60276.1 hypothetical protein [Vibrio sp. RE88]